MINLLFVFLLIKFLFLWLLLLLLCLFITYTHLVRGNLVGEVEYLFQNKIQKKSKLEIDVFAHLKLYFKKFQFVVNTIFSGGISLFYFLTYKHTDVKRKVKRKTPKNCNNPGLVQKPMSWFTLALRINFKKVFDVIFFLTFECFCYNLFWYQILCVCVWVLSDWNILPCRKDNKWNNTLYLQRGHV